MATRGSPAFEDVLGDLEGTDDGVLKEQVERAFQVMSLTDHPGWPLFIDYLTALTVTKQRRILNGNLETLEEYRFETGFVRGLQTAIEAPQKLLERVKILQEQASQAQGSSEPE